MQERAEILSTAEVSMMLQSDIAGYLRLVDLPGMVKDTIAHVLYDNLYKAICTNAIDYYLGNGSTYNALTRADTLRGIEITIITSLVKQLKNMDRDAEICNVKNVVAMIMPEVRNRWAMLLSHGEDIMIRDFTLLTDEYSKCDISVFAKFIEFKVIPTQAIVPVSVDSSKSKLSTLIGSCKERLVRTGNPGDLYWASIRNIKETLSICEALERSTEVDDADLVELLDSVNARILYTSEMLAKVK